MLIWAEKAEFLDIFYTDEHLIFYAQLSWAWKKFYNLRAWTGFVLTPVCIRKLLLVVGFIQQNLLFIKLYRWRISTFASIVRSADEV